MKLNEIVNSINTSLKTNLNQQRFQSGIFYGLAKLVLIKSQDTDSYSATIFDNSGKEINVTVDDTAPFQIYHRCISLSQVITQGAQFGDGNNNITETANMIAVVYGKKKVVQMCQEDLASVVMASFPDGVSITDIPLTKIKTVSVNNDSFSVFSQEYKSTDYSLNPEDYYFSIGYTVETTFDKTCVEKCC